MDFQSAIDLKSAISSSVIKKQRRTPVTFSLSAAVSPGAMGINSEIRSSVNGVGVGERGNGEHFIKILTKSKSTLEPNNLARYYGVNKQDIAIQETGLIKFKFPTNNHRPPFPGISVGHYQITAGTLGCYVSDNKNKVYVLSNNHVLANTNKAYYKDPILQPGKLDGGKKARDVIAELSYLVELQFVKPNTMDAAIAEVVQEIDPVFLINRKNKISGTTNPQNKMRVEKFGRTTGHTKGKISTRNLDLKVDFDGKEIDFQDQFEVTGNKGKMFCDGGDSGSLIFESGTLKAVGLLFAGSDDGTTFATPINEVLTEFSVKIL
ncbi:hypothetical protein FAM09_22235 [Niastella caeni]|uniref:Trypsin-like serine protease n=1 Tax=Niastella caeni TaxID=2569763 RepID=A0A4S8HLQ5_9BACT|nr:hypothetical protein [Niastella caeni]THU36105.1 hypothetical protein FAM09_22235 [Niastella caeni]